MRGLRGRGCVGRCAPVSACPRLHVGAQPHLAHVEHVERRGEVLAVDDLLDALTTEAAEHAADLCGAYKLTHKKNHSRHATCLLTTRHVTSIVSLMSNATAPAATEHRCLACGRKLATAEPYGEKCARKIRRALAALVATGEYTPAQAESAAELIADGGIVAVRETAKNGTAFHAVSSDGSAVHACTSRHCSCDAGRKGKTGCFHRLAARALRSAMAHPATAARSDYMKAA